MRVTQKDEETLPFPERLVNDEQQPKAFSEEYPPKQQGNYTGAPGHVPIPRGSGKGRKPDTLEQANRS